MLVQVMPPSTFSPCFLIVISLLKCLVQNKTATAYVIQLIYRLLSSGIDF